MKPTFRLSVIAFALLGVSLTGCGESKYPAYSETVKYGVRQDPIVRAAAKLGDERYDPDRPGVFPLMKMDEIFQPEHPYYAKASSKEINDSVLRDVSTISAKDNADLEQALEAAFGTPAAPKVAYLDAETSKLLKLDEAKLAEGSTYYRIHCLHCHGVPGDGRGPTSRWINPHPRDFRQGIFKFQSVDQATSGQQSPPARADLVRTLRNGIEGTAMPSFSLLPDHELDAIVSYVIHLSMRGTAEMNTLLYSFKEAKGTLGFKADDDDDGPADVKGAVKKWAGFAAKRWKTAQDPSMAIKVGPYPFPDTPEALKASVKRGQVLFIGVGADGKPVEGKTTCVSCHTDYGRQAKFRFDDWGTLARPNNFSVGIFRGGRRPVDIYYRVHSGINGSGMANFGKVLQPNEIWDLVNFVTNLSYPNMRDRLDIKID